MFSILVSALFVVCPVIAITLPNGFIIDDKVFLRIEPRINYAAERCEHKYDGCASDCSTQLSCSNGDHIVDSVNSNACHEDSPYCVKNGGRYSSCSATFPMSNQMCLTKAMNYFICSEDGQFPDPTDCSKYHICNGTSHTIGECPGGHEYTFDQNIEDPYVNPGNGEFNCRFKDQYDLCMCHPFSCSTGLPGSVAFNYEDYFHYGYCVQYGTMKKMVMFKCPPGTRHLGVTAADGSVECVPISTPIG